MRYVILGAGVAGISAMEAIRSVDQTNEIVLVGDCTGGDIFQVTGANPSAAR